MMKNWPGLWKNIADTIYNDLKDGIWYNVHQHLNSPSIKMLSDEFLELRSYVENELKCSFILTTLLRDPVERLLSHMYYRFSYVYQEKLDDR
eukprot:UN04910